MNKFFITTKVKVDRILLQDSTGIYDMKKATDYTWNGETYDSMVQLHLLRDEFICDKLVYDKLMEYKFYDEIKNDSIDINHENNIENESFIEVNPIFEFGIIEPDSFHKEYLGMPNIIPLKKQTLNEDSTMWHVHINHPVSIAFYYDDTGIELMNKKKFELKFYQDYYQMAYKII